MGDPLVRAARGGDRQAQRALYERHRRELYVYVRSILRDKHEAEDAVQEIFARALKALPSYDLRQPIRNWLLVIARNHVLDEDIEDMSLSRQVVALRHVLGLPPGEVAEILGTEPDLARQAEARALANLRDRLRTPA